MTKTNEANVDAPVKEGAPSLLVSLFALLFAPDRGMERHAKVGRARWFLLFALLCSVFLGAALATRVDARSSTLRSLEERGQLRSMSDRQIADETRSAERVAQVGSIAKGVVSAPLQLGLTSISLLALCWFFRGRIKGRAVAPVAAATLLPGAIGNVLDAITALRHTLLPPGGIPLSPRTLSAVLLTLGRPLPDPWQRFGNALDFFSLWAAVMLGYGVAATGQIPKRTALVGTLIAWTCFRLLTNVAARG